MSLGEQVQEFRIDDGFEPQASHDAALEANRCRAELRGGGHSDMPRVLAAFEARAHGCRLSEDEMRSILSLDLELNAQGLVIWAKG